MTMPPSPRRRPQRAGLTEHDGMHNTVLLILDMISCWNFPDGAAMQRQAARIAPAIGRLKRRGLEAAVPVIYGGQWRSDFKFVVNESMASDSLGAEITRELQPAQEDHFVLKPKHSALFATPLEILLDHLRAKRLLIASATGDQCVLSTALDARMRDFDVAVPVDCIASLTAERNRRAIEYLGEVLEVKVAPARAIRLRASAHRTD